MDHIKARSQHNTVLKDRVLWFDGDVAYPPNQLLRAMASGREVKYVTEPCDAVAEFNKNAASSQEIQVKTESRPISLSWTIPDEYKKLDVVEYLFKAHDILYENTDAHERSLRERRLAQELVKFKKLQLEDVLRAVIWIINTLTFHDTVWGVGRGSSVSSYVLYVIGVHDVDSFAYQLDIDDFLHE